MTCSFPRPLRLNRFGDDLFHYRWILVKELAEFLIYQLNHMAADIGIQLALGLPFKLRLREFHADHGCQAFADVVSCEVLFLIFEHSGLLGRRVDGSGQRAAETAKVRSAIDGI